MRSVIRNVYWGWSWEKGLAKEGKKCIFKSVSIWCFSDEVYADRIYVWNMQLRQNGERFRASKTGLTLFPPTAMLPYSDPTLSSAPIFFFFFFLLTTPRCFIFLRASVISYLWRLSCWKRWANAGPNSIDQFFKTLGMFCEPLGVTFMSSISGINCFKRRGGRGLLTRLAQHAFGEQTHELIVEGLVFSTSN